MGNFEERNAALYSRMDLIDHLDISSSLRGLVPVLPIQNRPSVSVQFDGGDNDIAGVDTDGGSRAVRLVSLHTVDVDDPFLAVDLRHLSLTTLVLSSNDADFVVFADWQRAAVVFGAEFLGEGRGHDLAAD